MNSDMAGCAIAIARIRHVVGSRLRRHAIALTPEAARAVVTFQAHREHDGPLQQPGVCRTVRRVTGFATIHADGGMLKKKRSALVRVAFEAGLFVL